MKIRVLQWNVLFSEPITKILRDLRSIRADVYCLEEVTTDSPENPKRDVARELARGLKMRFAYGAGGVWERYHYGNAILTRFPIIQKRVVFLRAPRGHNQSTRGYTEATLRIGGRPVTFGTIHMPFTPHFFHTPVKVKVAKELFRVVRQHRSRYILCGDLNSTPESYTIHGLRRSLKNAGPAYRENSFTRIPFSFMGFRARGLSYRVDYCFVTPDVRVVSARMIKNMRASDHLPILVEMEV